MAISSEPNAQNSEIDPQQHPSGARIEEMMQNAADARASAAGAENNARADIDSSRNDDDAWADEWIVEGHAVAPRSSSSIHQDRADESRYISPEEPSEGARSQATDAPHRMDQSNREDR